MVYKCSKCGSPFVRVKGWINPYDNVFLEPIEGDREGYCEECNELVFIDKLDNVSVDKYLEEYKDKEEILFDNNLINL